ncbi:MAG: NAD(P)H-dependent oxidoreductase [Bdellovibrionota bacterium]
MTVKGVKAKPKIVLITGSVRPNSLTTASLLIAKDEFLKLGCDVSFIDLKDLDMHSFLQMIPVDQANKYSKLVEVADAVMLATPEYNGSYSAVMKAIVEALGFPSPLDGKPVSLLGVAAGAIGAIKALEHMRSMVAHCGGIVLPFALSIKEAHLLIDDSGHCLDPLLENSIREQARKLVEAIS